MPYEIDTRWFKDRLADRDLTQRKVAATLDLDPAAVSLLLKGVRRMQIDEAARMAELLGVTLDEVMAHAGIEPPLEARGTVPIVGWVADDGEVHPGRIAAPRRAPLPPLMHADTVALRLQMTPGEFSMMDGWLMYYAPEDRVVPEAVGRMAVVQLAAKGPRYVRILNRGYAAGKWTLTSPFRPWEERFRIEDVKIDWACPVAWIRA